LLIVTEVLEVTATYNPVGGTGKILPSGLNSKTNPRENGIVTWNGKKIEQLPGSKIRVKYAETGSITQRPWDVKPNMEKAGTDCSMKQMNPSGKALLWEIHRLIKVWQSTSMVGCGNEIIVHTLLHLKFVWPWLWWPFCIDSFMGKLWMFVIGFWWLGSLCLLTRIWHQIYENSQTIPKLGGWRSFHNKMCLGLRELNRMTNTPCSYTWKRSIFSHTSGELSTGWLEAGREGWLDS
jgi:hypothetical protein